MFEEVWISVDGEVYWRPSAQPNGGRIVPPYVVVTSVGDPLRTRKRGLRHREERLVDGFCVVSRGHDSDDRYCGLYSAMAPLLEQRMQSPS